MKVGKIRKDQERPGKIRKAAETVELMPPTDAANTSIAQIFRAVPQFLASSRERILHAGDLATYESHPMQVAWVPG